MHLWNQWTETHSMNSIKVFYAPVLFQSFSDLPKNNTEKHNLIAHLKSRNESLFFFCIKH